MEVRKSNLTIVINKERRAGVADPGVVVLHMNHAHVLNAIENLAHRREILGIDTNGDGLEARNGLDDLGKDLLRRLGTAAPHIRAMRPQNPGALLLLVLAGHVESVLLWRRLALVNGLHVGS